MVKWYLKEATGIWVSAAAMLSFASTGMAAQPLRPDWVVDPTTRCRAWNPNPQGNETITWSGACRDGLAEGHGVLQWFHNRRPAARYEGELRGGKENGYGALTKPQVRYEGEFRDGKAHGLGHYVAPGYNLTGIWIDGCFREGNRIIGIGRDASSCP